MGGFRVNVNLSQYEGGRKRVATRVRKISDASEKAMLPVSIAMANHLKDAIVELLREPKSGITWSRENPLSGSWWSNVYTRPSGAAGEAPATHSGSLIDSIVVEPTSKDRANLDVDGPEGKPGVARLLEFGGWRSTFGNTVAAHPFIRPSLEKVRHELRDIAIRKYRELVKLGRV